MKIVMSDHAKYRSMERGIDIDKIKGIISKPGEIKQKFDGRVEVSKEIDGRNVIVIYKKEKNKFVIITVI